MKCTDLDIKVIVVNPHPVWAGLGEGCQFLQNFIGMEDWQT